MLRFFFFFSSRRRHTRSLCDWSSDVCSSDLDARRRVLAVLDRIMTINHVDDPNFAALLECQAKAREIRAAVLDPKGPTEESAAEILETTPAFSALLTLVEGREHLDDAKFAVLED